MVLEIFGELVIDTIVPESGWRLMGLCDRCRIEKMQLDEKME